jgi:hypothetical protein
MKGISKLIPAIYVVGFAIAGLLFPKAAEAVTLYRVSQETAVNSGNYNLLGYIKPFATTQTVSQYYNYKNSSFGGSNLQLVNDRSHLFLVQAKDGLALFSVHNSPATSDRTGGNARMQFDLLGDPNKASFMVRDDASDTYLVNGTVITSANSTLRGNTFTTTQNWLPGKTDGFAIGSLNDNWTMFARFTARTNLNSWTAYSQDGTNISLALENNRRVKIDKIEIPEPTATLSLLAVGALAVGTSALRRKKDFE